MLLYEYEGKDLLREHGIPAPRSVLIRKLSEIDAAITVLPPPVMIKAQVLSGQRGKAGGIRPAKDVAEARDAVAALAGATLKGLPVEAILVEEQVSLRHEYYVAVTLDGEEMLLLLGRQGGMDVETYFAARAESLIAVRFDPVYGIQDYQVRTALERLDVAATLWPAICDLAGRLVRLFRSSDATLVEVNPLAETTDGRLCALDARIKVDVGAFFRQPRLRAIGVGRKGASGVATRMKDLDIQYVPLGGEVGLISSGAGAGVAIIDWIDQEGGRASGFMDLDYAVLGGRTEDALALAVNHLNDEPAVRSLLVNFTSCGIRTDLVAGTLVKILDEAGERLRKPLFIHIHGNRAATAHAIIRQAGYRLCDRLGDAVRGAVRAAVDATIA